jgi:hypothetical protein
MVLLIIVMPLIVVAILIMVIPIMIVLSPDKASGTQHTDCDQ